MHNWQIDNYKEFRLFKTLYILFAIPVVIFALLNLADSEYALDSKIFIPAVAVLMLLNLLFFPKEKISIKSEDGDYFILKAPRFGNKNLLQLNIKAGSFDYHEVVKSSLLLGNKLIIHYRENHESKKIEIGLKNFSNKTRLALLKVISS